MRRVFWVLMLLFVASIAHAQCPGSPTTPNLALNTPLHNAANWDSCLNANFTKIDSYLSAGLGIPSLVVTGNVTIGGTVTCGSGCGGVTFGTDLSSLGVGSQEVVGILNNPLPALSAGCLNWTGSVWQFTSCGAISGSGAATQVTVWTSSSAVTGYSGLTTDSSGNVAVLSLATTGVGAGRVKVNSGTYSGLNGSFPCNSTNKDTISTISDANTQVWGATVAGGGTPGTDTVVFCDGTNYTVVGK